MDGYVAPTFETEAPKPLTSEDIDVLFKRSSGWFARDRTRKRLYAKGFPHPCERGRWSALAIKDWMLGVGANPDNVPPNVKPRRRRRSPFASGYARA